MRVEEVQTVMLVDDNITDRFIHKKLLGIYNIGNNIQEFASASDALEYIRREKDQPDNLPDIILLDVLMPEMDGFDFLIHLEGMKGELAKSPVIFMLSSTDDDNDLRRARENTMVQRLLRKPFSPDSLLTILSEL